MLQVASGRFFAPDATVRTEERRAVLFSNFSWPLPIHTLAGILEPAGPPRGICAYVFRFHNRTEERPGRMTVIGGEDVFVDQFVLLCAVGLGAYFATDRNQVELACRDLPRGITDARLPSTFVPRFFDRQIAGSPEDVDRLVELVRKGVRLPRIAFRSIMAALSAIHDALQTLSSNLDLAYSLLVYALEALSGSTDAAEPVWADMDERTRTRLDRVLARLSGADSDEIRAVLLDTQHLRARRKFVRFATEHSDGGLFEGDASTFMPLRRSHVERALSNAYGLRSGYAHRLKSIPRQLYVPAFNRGDVFQWDGEPYPTFAGLLKLALSCARSFISRSPEHDREDIDWESDLPYVVQARLAPQYWLGRVPDFSQLDSSRISEHIREQLAGFLSHLEAVTVDKSRTLKADLEPLLRVYCTLYRQRNATDRIRMLAIRMLWAAIRRSDWEADGWQEAVSSDNGSTVTCRIEVILANLIMNKECGFSAGEVEIALKIYNEERFHAHTLELPVRLELLLWVALANSKLTDGDAASFRTYLQLAIGEAAGLRDVQSVLQNSLTTVAAVDLNDVLALWQAEPVPMAILSDPLANPEVL